MPLQKRISTCFCHVGLCWLVKTCFSPRVLRYFKLYFQFCCLSCHLTEIYPQLFLTAQATLYLFLIACRRVFFYRTNRKEFAHLLFVYEVSLVNFSATLREADQANIEDFFVYDLRSSHAMGLILFKANRVMEINYSSNLYIYKQIPKHVRIAYFGALKNTWYRRNVKSPIILQCNRPSPCPWALLSWRRCDISLRLMHYHCQRQLSDKQVSKIWVFNNP